MLKLRFILDLYKSSPLKKYGGDRLNLEITLHSSECSYVNKELSCLETFSSFRKNINICEFDLTEVEKSVWKDNGVSYECFHFYSVLLKIEF